MVPDTLATRVGLDFYVLETESRSSTVRALVVIRDILPSSADEDTFKMSSEANRKCGELSGETAGKCRSLAEMFYARGA
ncbi:unnamed protein product [Ceratitis capitata]|uniref:(Mediterranean fruit fly) hypothetical protein n=1 Tax=Ceratitis capitata TaxID=7213 RepID=A0A811U874_CERCA|nr:unnamed protein product [Ceratitis capitata]